MDYRLKRGDQEFGPYSLVDLQQYLQTGHVAATDLAYSDGMTEWIPVSQVLGTIPIPHAAPAGLDGIPMATVSLPPNLHWILLLILDVCTRGYFNAIWALVQANWARKLIGKNTPLVLAAMYPGGMFAGGVAVALGSATRNPLLSGIGGVLILGGVICMIAAVFSIRGAMESYYNSVENIGLSLSGAMTFFFGVIYIQYHINQLAGMKKSRAIA